MTLNYLKQFFYLNKMTKSYLNLINNNEKILIISKDNCTLCDKLKNLFDTIDIDYTTYEYIEEEDDNLLFKTEMKETTGGTLFPFCYFNNKYIGNYKDIHKNLMTGKLTEQLLEIGIEYEEYF